MDFHFATAWELISDTVPESRALICGDSVRSWREYEERAARIAAVLSAHGLGPDSKTGIYLHNSNEYAEAQFGVFKQRGCPINVNYRYKADELLYLLDNADVEAIVYQGCYAMRIWEIRDKLPKLKCLIQVDDGSGESLLDGALDYEQAIAETPPMPRIERAFEDIYMLYTGGTTGMPKGVMYHNGQFCAAMGAGFVARGLELPMAPEQLPERVRQVAEMGLTPVSLAACPQMHGTGMWLGTMIPHLMGGAVVTLPHLHFDPDALWETVQRERVTDIAIVGDAFAKPMLAALERAAAAGRPYDISSMYQIVSSGVMWSAEVKRGLLEHHDMILYDTMGSTEGGMGAAVSDRSTGTTTAKFTLNEGVKVFTEAGVEVAPGSGEIGLLATSGNVPLGYYKDPEKSARTFREIDGVRYSFPGDFATVEADGTITLLGRGSQCINTGGEKVFPEEVEEAAKRHPDVADCLVVGVPDERFGERIVAVIGFGGESQPDDESLRESMREHLAGYKLPRHFVRVDRVQRAPNGKADYKWARRVAVDSLEG